MAAGEAVPPAAMMTHAMVDYPNVSSSPIAASEPRPFLQIMAATNRASHPSGSSDQRCSAFALAAAPPRRTLVPFRVHWIAQTRGCRFPGANPLLAHVTGDPRCCPGDGQRHPIQAHGSSSRPLTGLAAAVVTHAKQRLVSKGARSFRMWKQARANLCASALVATTLLVLAFFRS